MLSFLFPLTIAFAELPTYFGYCMPRLAAQHMFLPLIWDGGYLLWRMGMFLPFALFTGIVIKLRPALLPYFVIVHALLDVTTVLIDMRIYTCFISKPVVDSVFKGDCFPRTGSTFYPE